MFAKGYSEVQNMDLGLELRAQNYKQELKWGELLI